jgi:hypothetical protein
MSSPLFYILAPFALAFGLFAVFLIVSIFLKDPARPFRMFAAPPLKGSPEYRDQSPGEGEEEEQEPSTSAKASADRESRSQPFDKAQGPEPVEGEPEEEQEQ